MKVILLALVVGMATIVFGGEEICHPTTLGSFASAQCVCAGSEDWISYNESADGSPCGSAKATACECTKDDGIILSFNATSPPRG